MYRRLVGMEFELVQGAMRLTSIEKLASTCPRCFGPSAPGKKDTETDFVVCVDGNFQHRRHLAASAERPNAPVYHPELFLSPNFVDEWAEKLQRMSRTGRDRDPDIEVRVLWVDVDLSDKLTAWVSVGLTTVGAVFTKPHSRKRRTWCQHLEGVCGHWYSRYGLLPWPAYQVCQHSPIWRTVSFSF